MKAMIASSLENADETINGRVEERGAYAGFY